MSGYVDTSVSRRTSFFKCYFWKREKIDTNYLNEFKFDYDNEEIYVHDVNDDINPNYYYSNDFLGQSSENVDTNNEFNAEVYKKMKAGVRFKYSGKFDAKQPKPEAMSKNIIAGVLMTDSYVVTLESYDDLSELEANDIVIFNDDFYRVESCQGVPLRSGYNQFNSKGCKKYTVILVK